MDVNICSNQGKFVNKNRQCCDRCKAGQSITWSFHYLSFFSPWVTNFFIGLCPLCTVSPLCVNTQLFSVRLELYLHDIWFVRISLFSQLSSSGTYMKAECDGSKATECARCEDGQYTATINHSKKCQACRDCSHSKSLLYMHRRTRFPVLRRKAVSFLFRPPLPFNRL